MKAEVRESASRKRIYFATRDLLIMAVLSGIGGVLSTYVGYLGNLLNRLFGVPFGAGQFVAGLHVFGSSWRRGWSAGLAPPRSLVF